MHLRTLLLSCGCILAATSRGADVVRITDEDEFSSFVKSVNSGTNYSGTTVLLDSDLSFPGKTLGPIGKDSSNCFLGTFDGQGHTISDFKMNTYSDYLGLFGYSKGLAIRNVVLDSSCSITNSYGSRYVGGIIGYCSLIKNQCRIENSVNMADIIFTGKISSGYLYLGGIIGYMYSSDYNPYVKNCANYGSITHPGTSYNTLIGGIVGNIEGSYYTYIQNCLNYGAITHSGTSDSQLYLGGIIGYSKYTYIENCASAGNISISTTPSKSYIGSIIGSIGSSAYLYYCYYTSDLAGYEKYGYGTPLVASHILAYDSTAYKLDEPLSIGNYTGDSLVGALNAAADYYYVLDYYSNWIINKDSNTVAFTVNGMSSPTTMSYKVILLPELPNEDKMWFDGWYTDSGCTKPIESFEITENIDLYGKYEENTNSYTVSFDTRGGSYVAPITAQFWDEVELPSDLVKGHCAISSWETLYGDNAGFSLTMPAHNITLYAVWKCIHIATPDDFIRFSKAVNSGTSYSGTTVFLDSDLSLSGVTEPIGKDDSNCFLGTFDGQGHTISDLKMNSSSITSYYTGLFGYSEGLTIKNVVLDSSCSIMNSYSISYLSCFIYVGGIIGYCRSIKNQCKIENNVNMADVIFTGKIGKHVSQQYLGGVIGKIQFFKYFSYVKNCANYGSITHPGTSYTTHIGGIIGDLSGSSSYYTYIQNCLNYGAITHSGTSSNQLYIGGIVGDSSYVYIENCVSAGNISISTTPSTSYVGSIAGYIGSSAYLYYCYYTSDLAGYEKYGGETPVTASHILAYDSTAYKLDEPLSIGNYTGDSLVGALNAAADYYYVLDYYSNWIINKDSNTVAFTVNGMSSPTTMSYKVILLPELANEDKMWFDGWYTDSGCTKPIESFEITENIDLYGKYEENTNSYTVSFDTRGGSYVAPITAQFWDEVPLPDDVTKDDCTISSWETLYGDNAGFSLTMPAHNITLYAVWKCTRIATPDDFIRFSKAVNSGVNYSGTTVFLDSDLSLSGVTEPIGKDDSNCFLGTFDGQGHVISGLKISSSSSAYTGLFGDSEGLTIKNVVLDSSCSISSLYGASYVGGIIGSCESYHGECKIENNVNMADITFNWEISSENLHLGGIIGALYLNSYSSTIRNCANYGSVTHSGISVYSRIGGIVGDLNVPMSCYTYIQNCLNYGAITHSGTSSGFFYLGGIIGYSKYTYIENCVSAGKVSTIESLIGSLVGYVDHHTYVYYCYYTSDTDLSELYGYRTPTNTTGTPDSPSTVNSTLVSKLNEYAAGQSWNRWLLNKNNALASFVVNYGKKFGTNSQVVLLPDPADSGKVSFSGWFNDTDLTSPFTSSEVEIPTTLYGMFCESNYTVTLDVNGGDASSIPSTHKKAVVCDDIYRGLLTPTRTGYTFTGWFTEREGGEKVESGSKVTKLYDHSLYAHWTPRKYTVTLNANGGDVPAVKEVSVTFNSTYGDLPAATRDGYVFLGWFTEDNESVTSETVVSIPSDHTLYAHWTINNFTLTFDFDNGAAPDVRTLKFGDPIVYPPNPTKEGCAFVGWDKSVSQMPASDLTITALWRELPDERNAWYSASPSLAVATMIAILDFVIILAAIAFIIMFLFYAKRR